MEEAKYDIEGFLRYQRSGKIVDEYVKGLRSKAKIEVLMKLPEPTAAQPEEGSRGYSRDQLSRLGTDLGITSPDFATCVSTSRYNPDIQRAESEATNLPYLQRDIGNNQKAFSTPTIAVGQTMIDTTDPKWLDKLLTSG